MRIRLIALSILIALPAPAGAVTAQAPAPQQPPAQKGQPQTEPPPPGVSNDPFPQPIAASQGVITVRAVEFATVPDFNGAPARMMLLSDEPGTRRMFVNDMRGPLYTVSRDGKQVALYLDINAAEWNVRVNSQGSERGFQSFAFHPDFARRGAPGFGKFYTFTDTSNTEPAPDFVPGGGNNTHDMVLLEWTAKDPAAAAYDGGAPRELMRFEHPFANHNGGQIAFNPLAKSGTPEYGLLYIGSADGGSGGDPLDLSQNMSSAFGKMLRIDPLGTNSKNGKYGIPPGNPFVKDASALPEIYALGLRNPQRFTWDPRNGNLFVADIGQNTVEEVSLIRAGGNYGWNDWEGSYRFFSRQGVHLENKRSDPKMIYPVVEYGQPDPLFMPNSAVTMGVVYRATEIKALTGLLLFGDNPSGEVFYINADKLPSGGQDPIRRVLFDDGGTPKTLLQLIKQKNEAQGRKPATRADLRFGSGANGEVFLLNKGDGTIRRLAPR
jgi:glucose/arabinose dehydrogenase